MGALRKVTIVVPVLITNCQLSLYSRRGPVHAQIMISKRDSTNVVGLPAIVATNFAKLGNDNNTGVFAIFDYSKRQ